MILNVIQMVLHYAMKNNIIQEIKRTKIIVK